MGRIRSFTHKLGRVRHGVSSRVANTIGVVRQKSSAFAGYAFPARAAAAAAAAADAAAAAAAGGGAAAAAARARQMRLQNTTVRALLADQVLFMPARMLKRSRRAVLLITGADLVLVKPGGDGGAGGAPGGDADAQASVLAQHDLSKMVKCEAASSRLELEFILTGAARFKVSAAALGVGSAAGEPAAGRRLPTSRSMPDLAASDGGGGAPARGAGAAAEEEESGSDDGDDDTEPPRRPRRRSGSTAPPGSWAGGDAPSRARGGSPTPAAPPPRGGGRARRALGDAGRSVSSTISSFRLVQTDDGSDYWVAVEAFTLQFRDAAMCALAAELLTAGRAAMRAALSWLKQGLPFAPGFHVTHITELASSRTGPEELVAGPTPWGTELQLPDSWVEAIEAAALPESQPLLTALQVPRGPAAFKVHLATPAGLAEATLVPELVALLSKQHHSHRVQLLAVPVLLRPLGAGAPAAASDGDDVAGQAAAAAVVLDAAMEPWMAEHVGQQADEGEEEQEESDEQHEEEQLEEQEEEEGPAEADAGDERQLAPGGAPNLLRLDSVHGEEGDEDDQDSEVAFHSFTGHPPGSQDAAGSADAGGAAARAPGAGVAAQPSAAQAIAAARPPRSEDGGERGSFGARQLVTLSSARHSARSLIRRVTAPKAPPVEAAEPAVQHLGFALPAAPAPASDAPSDAPEPADGTAAAAAADGAAAAAVKVRLPPRSKSNPESMRAAAATEEARAGPGSRAPPASDRAAAPSMAALEQQLSRRSSAVLQQQLSQRSSAASELAGDTRACRRSTSGGSGSRVFSSRIVCSVHGEDDEEEDEEQPLEFSAEVFAVLHVQLLPGGSEAAPLPRGAAPDAGGPATAGGGVGGDAPGVLVLGGHARGPLAPAELQVLSALGLAAAALSCLALLLLQTRAGPPLVLAAAALHAICMLAAARPRWPRALLQRRRPAHAGAAAPAQPSSRPGSAAGGAAPCGAGGAASPLVAPEGLRLRLLGGGFVREALGLLEEQIAACRAMRAAAEAHSPLVSRQGSLVLDAAAARGLLEQLAPCDASASSAHAVLVSSPEPEWMTPDWRHRIWIARPNLEERRKVAAIVHAWRLRYGRHAALDAPVPHFAWFQRHLHMRPLAVTPQGHVVLLVKMASLVGMSRSLAAAGLSPADLVAYAGFVWAVLFDRLAPHPHPGGRLVMVTDMAGIRLGQAVGEGQVGARALGEVCHAWPERLARCLVVGAPAWFNMLYRMVRPHLSPSTRAKVQVCESPAEAAAELAACLGPDLVPEEFGGPCRWSYDEYPAQRALLQLAQELAAAAEGQQRRCTRRQTGPAPSWDQRVTAPPRLRVGRPLRGKMATMDPPTLRALCVQHKLYRTPELNDKLYLNFQGFGRIAGLEEYTGLKALFLEGNALQSLDGLPPLEQLKCLYVQQNCLRSLAALERVPGLDTLNVASNGLDSLEGLQACPGLATLVAEGNRLGGPAALAPLAACARLHTLDLQSCGIEDGEAVLSLVAALPELRCLHLKGNPAVGAIPSYRKTVVASCPRLTYLDDRPISEEERACCEAWARGGLEAERDERARLKEEAAARERRNFDWMQQLRREGFRKRRAMLGLPDGDTDPYFDTLQPDQAARAGADPGAAGDGGAAAGEGDADQDDETLALLREPPELRDARRRLAAFTGEEGAAGAPAAAAAKASEDGEQYLASVRAAQRELDAAGAPAASAAGSGRRGAAALISEVQQAGADQLPALARLRAATEAAQAAAGLLPARDEAEEEEEAPSAEPPAEVAAASPEPRGVSTAGSWSSSSGAAREGSASPEAKPATAGAREAAAVASEDAAVAPEPAGRAEVPPAPAPTGLYALD
ncbi:ODA7 [Scenedesmus sp. PABB004]|nr:ODA7 [Scenedesmus sp. PABB004]